MTLTEFHALVKSDPRKAGAMVAEKVMGWRCGGWRDETWLDADGIGHGTIYGWSPTTDRNACAMVVKRVVASPARQRFVTLLVWELGMGAWKVVHETLVDFCERLLLADPALLCWCALEAVKEGGRDARSV
jgi:hypothetical protein